MIRKAVKTDAKVIARLMVSAMEGLAKQFTASTNIEDAYQLFEHFCGQPHNQYSFEHTLVYLIDEQIVGAVTGYDGGSIERLRQPFFEYISKVHHATACFEMELESGPGEFYIDTLSVDADHQGKGIGKALILAAIELARNLGHQKVGLLVDRTNPDAKRLYERLGFTKENDKWLLGKPHEHLTYAINH